MKPITWLGDTYKVVKEYPANVRKEIGYSLDKLQRGLELFDWKPMTTVGQGVREIRVHQENEYRIFYVAKFEESIYVLHVFTKKTQHTSQKDIDLGKDRYKEVLKIRGH